MVLQCICSCVFHVIYTTSANWIIAFITYIFPSHLLNRNTPKAGSDARMNDGVPWFERLDLTCHDSKHLTQ